MLNAVSVDAWEFLGVCVPIVVIGAPLGSLIGTHFHRQVNEILLYECILDTHKMHRFSLVRTCYV